MPLYDMESDSSKISPLILLVFLFFFFLIYFWLRWGWVLVAACGLSLVAVHGLLIAVASLSRSRALGVRASAVVAHRLSCSAACGVFPDQGLNPCPLHWQADS